MLELKRLPSATLSADDPSDGLAFLARHRSGDPSALNRLLIALYPSVHRMIYRLASSSGPDAHDDLVQSALEQVCRSLDAFQGRSRFSTFVFGICYRVVGRARRRDRVRAWFKREAENVCLPQATTPPDALLDQARGVAAARAALARLHAEERAAFVLHEVEDLPLVEVALALHCSTRTVRRRLRAARQQLLSERRG